MVIGDVSSSIKNGEGAQTPFSGILSVLLFPPLAALLAGILLFVGLSRISLNDSFTHGQVILEQSQKELTIAALFTPEVQNWKAEIVAWATAHGLEPNLVATVMQIESCGNPNALSSAGAMGLFQVMPYHFAEGEDPYETENNAKRGLGYLRQAMNSFEGDENMALAGYNGGINGASRPISEWAEETVGYQYWGSGIFTDAQMGKAESERLNEWLAAGGASLCRSAQLQLSHLSVQANNHPDSGASEQ